MLRRKYELEEKHFYKLCDKQLKTVLTGSVLQFLQSVFEKCYNLVNLQSLSSFQGKSCEISELSAMSIKMTTDQNVGN